MCSTLRCRICNPYNIHKDIFRFTPSKKEMMFLLHQFAGDGLSNSESEKWVDRINQGGLLTINDQAYNFFFYN